MANYTNYIPIVGRTKYPTQLAAMIDASETFDTEIENARDGEVNLVTSMNLKIDLAGGTMTGDLTLNGNPTLGLHPVPRQYMTTNYLQLSGGNITGSLTVNSKDVAVKDAALTDGNIITSDASGRITTTSGIVATNLATLSWGQTFTGTKTFDAIPVFNGGESGVSAPFIVDSNYIIYSLNSDLLDGQEGSYYTQLANETLTGTPSFPTGTTGITQTLADDSTKVATTEFVQNEYDTYELLPNWTSASQVGSSLSISETSAVLAGLTSTDIAYVDDANNQLRTYRFNGSTWSLVGSGLGITVTGLSALTSLDSTNVAFISAFNDDLIKYTWNGSTWSQVGNSFTIADIQVPVITALNSTDVAFIDTYNEQLTTYRYGGPNWSQVGNDLYISTPGSKAIAAFTDADIAFIDSSDEELKTYHFDGTDWAQVGSSLTISGIGVVGLTALNSTDIAFVDQTIGYLRTYRWDGSIWSQVGSGLFIESGSFRPTLAVLNGTDVAYINDNSDNLNTYRFGYYLGDGPYHA